MKASFVLPLILLSVVFVSACAQYQPTTTTTQVTTTTIAGQTATPTALRQSSISVSSQSLVGGEIVIDSLYLDKPGYIVIHKDDSGKPGSVIGHSELVSGEKNNFKVLINASQAGANVFAMLHYDDDNDGVYGFPDEDKPVVLEGNVAVKPISIVQKTIAAVEILSSGFSSKTTTIKAGDAVRFVNKDSSRQHWPASDVHPVHTVYPGSGLNKCGTADASSIFDACKGLALNEEWSFTFSEKGSWSYHDHLSTSLTGTVVVE